ncbi:hypothetical protein C5Z25_11655 [Lactobacillus sp. CBA3605]|uniref:ATP-grasp domain-containing protein n=1 Tax=Lactobacillus sp. CBA3605 TaxID=2099788 RepID=UPI000CFB3CA2|nr:hypothetical protein [Lactobacillus sp. CBA3605]AVK62371.1 hypothetical protein C5Z25_11655 [Lactobacillus sp. CBA3605]
MNLAILCPAGPKYYHFIDFLNQQSNDYFYLFVPQSKRKNFSQVLSNRRVNLVGIKEWQPKSVISSVEANFQQHAFDRIIALDEFDIETAALIRNHLHLPGQTRLSANAFRNKISMKTLLRRHNIKTANFISTDNDTKTLEKFARSCSFPLVGKPQNGAGSENVEIIRDHSQLKKYLAKLVSPANNMLESFINMPTYHIDGLMIDNQFMYVIPSRYFHDCLSFIQAKSVGSIQLNDYDPDTKRLVEYAKHVVSDFPHPDNLLFHLEVFYDGQTIIFNEIGSRLGGGKIRDCLAVQIQHNPINLLLNAELKRPDYNHPLSYTILKPCGFILSAPQVGTLTNLPNMAKVIFKDHIFACQQYTHINAFYKSIDLSALCTFAVAVQSSSAQNTEKELLAIDDWIRKQSTYH